MLWELAEKELKAASQILEENREMISCFKCRMFLEASIYQQYGDLYRNRFCGSTRGPIEMLSRAGDMYRSALHRLNGSGWKNSITSSEEAVTDQIDRNNIFNCKMDHLDRGEIQSEIERPNVKEKQKRCRKAKKDNVPTTNGLRMTRSRCRALESNAGTTSVTALGQSSTNSKCCDFLSESCSTKQRALASESSSSFANCTCEITSLLDKMKCWHCLALQVSKNMSLNDLVHMKSEVVWRRLSMILLIGIGTVITGLRTLFLTVTQVVFYKS